MSRVSDAVASSLHIGMWTEVTFVETLPQPYGEATVKAKLDEQQRMLAKLELYLGSSRVEIPAKAFSDLPKPNLRTIELSYGGENAAKWYAVLRFEYGDPITPEGFDEDLENRDRFSSVEIRISEMRATSRMIFRAEDGGSSSYEPL